MRLEKEIRREIMSILTCTACATNRPRILLLAGMILESTVDMLSYVFIDDNSIPGQSLLDRLGNIQQSGLEY
jgi:hypothetical protein